MQENAPNDHDPWPVLDEPALHRSFEVLVAKAGWSRRWTLPRLFRLQPHAYGRLLIEAGEMGFGGRMAGCSVDARLICETWARYGDQLLGVVPTLSGMWRPEDFVSVGRLVIKAGPALRTRPFDERVATHRQFVFDDVEAQVHGALAPDESAVQAALGEGGFATSAEEVLDSRRMTYLREYRRVPRHPLTAMYVTPAALVDAVLGGPQAEVARQALLRLASVMGAHPSLSVRQVAQLPRPEHLGLPAADGAVTSVAAALQRTFLVLTQHLADTVPYTRNATVARLPFVPAEVVARPTTVPINEISPLPALHRPPVPGCEVRTGFATVPLRQWAAAGSLARN